MDDASSFYLSHRHPQPLHLLSQPHWPAGYVPDAASGGHVWAWSGWVDLAFTDDACIYVGGPLRRPVAAGDTPVAPVFKTVVSLSSSEPRLNLISIEWQRVTVW